MATDTVNIPHPREEELYCYWKDCLRPFPDHDALSHHLSEDHIGWKKREYCCEWTNCSRKGVKCHNRFALVMHLRIHTQEKPFECNIEGCNMNFGRMDALSRHKKAEHGLDTSVDMDKTTPSMQDPNNIIKKRKGIRDDYPDNQKRGKSDTGREQQASDMGESEDTDVYDMTATTSDVTPIHAQQQHQHQQQKKHTSSSSNMTPQNKYKIAKAKLQYILRENEMLNDEWTSLQRRLGRLQTERRVLLDALMTVEDDQEGDLLSMDEEDEDGGDAEPTYDTINQHSTGITTKNAEPALEKYPSSMIETTHHNQNGYAT